MSKHFTRKIEDFVCEHCGQKNKGNGYTNHCFKCLYSKHVDTNPGDRQASCQELMRPVAVHLKNGQYVISHRCEKCGVEKDNKTSAEDNFDAILKIISGK